MGSVMLHPFSLHSHNIKFINISYKMLKKLSNFSIDTWHLVVRTFFFGVMTVIILYYVAPITFWLIFGEGAISTQVARLPITTFCWTLFAPLFLFPIIVQRFIANYNKGRFSKAKDYLIVAPLVLFLSIIITYMQTG